MPRFVVHSFAHEQNGESKTTNMLIYYCPGKAKPKNKMFYSTAKSSVIAIFSKYGEIKNVGTILLRQAYVSCFDF